VYEGPHQQEDYTLVYNISMGLAAAVFFFIGLIYDRIGAQWCGFYGAILVGFGFFGMSAAVYWKGLQFLIFVAFPWAYIFGALNGFSIYGFLWLFPKYLDIYLV
jgi:hypothetical protein